MEPARDAATIIVPNEAGWVRLVRLAVAGAADPARFGLEDAHRLRLAVGELFTAVAASSTEPITFHITPTDDGGVRVEADREATPNPISEAILHGMCSLVELDEIAVIEVRPIR